MEKCDSHMKILKDGTWLHKGVAIKRHNMVKLFARVLMMDDHGVYWLKTPVEKAEIEVEDVPFIITDVRFEGSGADQTITITTNIDERYVIGAEHPLILREGAGAEGVLPYAITSKGLLARPSRPVYYDLVAKGIQKNTESSQIGVWSARIFFPLEK